MEPKLPWDETIRLFKKDQMTFHDAAPIVGKLKE